MSALIFLKIEDSGELGSNSRFFGETSLCASYTKHELLIILNKCRYLFGNLARILGHLRLQIFRDYEILHKLSFDHAWHCAVWHTHRDLARC